MVPKVDEEPDGAGAGVGAGVAVEDGVGAGTEPAYAAAISS